MRYGFVLLPAPPGQIAALAREAEEVGWDAVFVSDLPWGIDPWITLAAAAMKTERIRLGTMLTPPSRRRPWTLASQTATLDVLSGGRLILAIGLGALDSGFEAFGEETDLRTRAELMDEGMAVVDGLWRGQPFRFEGKHYRVEPIDFFAPPPPVQSPRPPVWVVGAWPYARSMRRVLRWDGLIPQKPSGEITPDDIHAMKEWIEERRPGGGQFDIVWSGETDGADRAAAADQVRPWAEAGATWWLETRWTATDWLEPVRERIRQGPPA